MERSDMDVLKLGLIGAGRIGKVHAQSVAYHVPHARITRIADIAPEPARVWAAELGIRSVTADAREILDDPEIGAVVICSSTDTHADLIMAAAAKGKHVFCEKPVDLTLAKVKAAVDAVERAKVKLQVGFNRRFDHNFKRIRDLVREGVIGTPHVVRITSRDPAPPPLAYVKVSGGIFLDMTIHDFDLARYLSGSEVVEVYAKGAVLVDPAIGAEGDVDTAIVTLEFQNGCLGVIDNSRKAVYGYDQRVEVFGAAGSLACENDTPTSVVHSGANGVTGDKPLYFFLERYQKAYIDEMNAFVEAVLGGTPTPVGCEDAIQSLVIGLAARKSLAEKRPVRTAEISGAETARNRARGSR
jgi:myo-inositol 2-dehydrogenase/D-chiro-inositol 1-dehydrogenase